METSQVECLPVTNCQNKLGVIVNAEVEGGNEGNQVLHEYWLCREIMEKHFQFEPEYDPEMLLGELVYVNAFMAL